MHSWVIKIIIEALAPDRLHNTRLAQESYYIYITNGSHPSAIIRADITTQSVIYKTCSQLHTPSHMFITARRGTATASLVE